MPEDKVLRPKKGPEQVGTFKDGTRDLGVAGLARLLTKLAGEKEASHD